jgi:hypothetical protein
VRGGRSFAQDEREAATIEYLFTGKLTLFPLAILFLGIGAGVLLRYGDKPYLGGYFQSVEMYYGIAGAPPRPLLGSPSRPFLAVGAGGLAACR